MTIEQITSKIDSLGTNTAVMVPSDTNCHAYHFVNKKHAAKEIANLADYWNSKGLDTEYSFTSIGNVEMWDYELLRHAVKECYRIDAVNDDVLKFCQFMANSDWAKD